MNLLRLTRGRDNKAVYINPDKITSMEEDGGFNLIVADGKNHWVKESAEKIISVVGSQRSKTNR